MATTPLVVPPGVSADGSVLVAFVPAIGNPSAPTLAELNAATALNISCYLSTGSFKPGANDETATDERLCSKQVFETLGQTTWTIDNLEYIYDPQNPSSLSNKAYAAMKRGTHGYLVVRWGKDLEEFPEFAAGDVVDVFPVSLGSQVKQPPEKNSKLKVQQKPVVTGPVVEDVALAS